MTLAQPSSPPRIPRHAATPLLVPLEPCMTCSCLCRALKVNGSSAKAQLKSCAPVKHPKNPVSVCCQEKACLGLKCVQKSHSLMKNCGCQSSTVELHLLHINDSTSSALALQYPNIGNINVQAFPNVNCQTCKSWGLGAQQSHCITHIKCSLCW